MKYVNELIYKQDAIDALYHVNEYNSQSIKVIRQLPPAELERQKGNGYIITLMVLNVQDVAVI